MIEEFKYILLGLIQGLAEFFPISSSGHIILFSSILDVAEEHPLLLSITVHFATTLSTIIIYRQRLKMIFSEIIKNHNKNEIDFFLKIIFSALPIIIIGLLFRTKIELIFEELIYLVSVMLMLTGFILITTRYIPKGQQKITFYHAFLIGIAQAFAIIPGISRSGATISMALMCKINRKDAAEFSFLMVLTPIIGITFIELTTLWLSDYILEDIHIKGLFLAFFTSLLSGLFACKYMIKLIQNNSLKYFGYYCILIGLLSYFFLF